MNSPAAPSHPDSFWPETRATWISDLSAANSRGQALENLCTAYRRPLIRTVQSALPELSTTEAEDVVQQFFADDVFPSGTDKPTLFDSYQPEQGLLRHYLRGALRNFISSWLRARRALKRGGGYQHVSLDDPDHAEADWLPHGLDPFFDREWALDVFSAAFQKLETHYLADEERARRYHVLQPWLVGYEDEERISALAEELGITPGALRTFLHRLRADWQDALRAIIAPTVASPGQVEEELRYLCSVLRG